MTGGGQPQATAVVFLTHRLDEIVVRRFRKLVDEVPGSHDAFLAYDESGASPQELEKARALSGSGRLHRFQPGCVRQEAPGGKRRWRNSEEMLPGDPDIVWLDFFGRHPAYARYWFVEYDVAYTGHWSSFFAPLADRSADLLGTTLRRFRTQPSWPWWPSLATGRPHELPDERRIAGFFPVVGLSRRALEVVVEAHRAGWTGHFEVLIPTLLSESCLAIEDVGGDGRFVRTGNVNRFYTNTLATRSGYPGTFVYRPARPRPGLRRQKLWHPVKPDCGRLIPYLRMARHWLAAGISGAGPFEPRQAGGGEEQR